MVLLWRKVIMSHRDVRRIARLIAAFYASNNLYPFDDGNGRIARAIGDLLLARADGSPQRFQ